MRASGTACVTLDEIVIWVLDVSLLSKTCAVLSERGNRAAATTVPIMVILNETVGDVFDSPENSVLIHSSNALGSWDAGVAASFRTRYPQAYAKYKNHCYSLSHKDKLVGTCLLIEPCDKTRPSHWVACLFTSRGFGKSVDNEADIVSNTERSLADLSAKLTESKDQGQSIGDCFSVKINSGLFRVDWELTKRVIDASDVRITVVVFNVCTPALHEKRSVYIGFAD